MMRGRIASACFLACLAIPLVLTVQSTLRDPQAWMVWTEWDRIGILLGHTILLAGGACLIALPLGAFLAIAITRFRTFGSPVLTGGFLLALAVPMPVTAVAWQIVLGQWWSSWNLDPGQVAWRPWQQGLLPAAFVHGMAAVPWVTAIVAAVLRRTDPAIEESARMEGGTGLLMRRVLIPRLALALSLSAAWIGVICATEIPVTDAMMVRSIAEEVYAEMVGNPAGVHAAVAVALPILLVACVVAIALANQLIFHVIPGSESVAQQANGRSRLVSFLAWATIGLAFGVPLFALIVRAGNPGSGFLVSNLFTTLQVQIRDRGFVLLECACFALITGLIVTGVAWSICLVCGARVRGVRLLIGVAIVLWLTPGPIVGVGLKEAINGVLDLEEGVLHSLGVASQRGLFRAMLYDRPSPLPAMLASAVRWFPVAVAFLLPAVRAIPIVLREQLRIDGANGIESFRRVGIPLTGTAAGWAVFAVSALTLGEVSASKLVNPPGYRAFILDLFNQMHYGAESGVAGQSLVMVGFIAAVLGVSFAVVRRSTPGR